MFGWRNSIAYPRFTELRLMINMMKFFFANRQKGFSLAISVLNFVMIVLHIQYSMDTEIR